MKCGLDKKELRDPDGGVHLARKKAQLGILERHIPDCTALFPTTGFTETLQGLPQITFKTVWTYMVTSVGAKKQLSTAKPLVKGFNFYKSGHVFTVKSCNGDNGSRCYVKSQVLPSMKKSEAYLCHIVIRSNGLVQKASCGCPAGIDGRCNHVAATLFSLEEFCKVRKQQNEEACTSQSCKWNVPRKRKIDLVPIANMKFRKHEHAKMKKSREPVISPGHDVRPAKYRNTNANTNTKRYNTYSKVIDFQSKTGKLIGLSHILQQHTTNVIKEAVSLDHNYSKPSANDDDEQLCSYDAIQPTDHKESINLISPIKIHPVSLSEIQKRCEAVIDKLQVTEDEVNTIELQTRKQSHCSEWFHHRKYRITASKAYRCASLRESTSPTKAVEEVLCYKKVYSTKAMKDGLNQEPVIVNEYTKEKENNGVNVVVKDCGFFVSSACGFLGASPDGLITEHDGNMESTGLLEMKFIQLNDSETLTDALLRKRICVSINDCVKVNTKHKYYYQVQHQMFVTGKTWTDFVVKGSLDNSLYIERVEFNSVFWAEVLPKLKSFFNKYMLPEIVYPSIKYGQARRILCMETVVRQM